MADIEQAARLISGRARDRQASAALRGALSLLAPGAAATFTLPDAEPARRIAYQRINGMAHLLWGTGGYRLRIAHTHATITRLKDRDQ